MDTRTGAGAGGGEDGDDGDDNDAGLAVCSKLHLHLHWRLLPWICYGDLGNWNWQSVLLHLLHLDEVTDCSVGPKLALRRQYCNITTYICSYRCGCEMRVLDLGRLE